MNKWLVLGCLCLVGCSGLQGAQAPTQVIPLAEQLGVVALEFNAAGTRFATASVRGEVSIWSFPENRKLQQFWEHSGRVEGLFWAGDTYVITGGSDRKIVLYDLASGQTSATELQLNSTIHSLTYVPQRNWVVSGHLDGTVRAFQMPELTPIGSYETDETVVAVAASAQGVIASAGDGGQTLVFEQGLDHPRELTRSDRDALELRFSKDGQKLLGSGWKLLIWDVASGRLVTRNPGHLGAFSSLDVSPDNRLMATIGCQADAKVQLFDFETGVLQRQLAPHELCGHAVRFSPNGQYVVTASEDESVHFYDVTIPYNPQIIQPHLD